MSVYAQTWAFDQDISQAGAKFVLVALANFADEVGFCFPSQATLSRMTNIKERTVRAHLRYLEEELKLIRREERRNAKGQITSDGFYLLAPSERLKPRLRDQRQDLPEARSASGEIYRRQDLPAAKSTVGKKRSNQRQNPPAARSARDTSVKSDEPSVEPSEVGSRPKARSPNIANMSDEEFIEFLKSEPAYSHIDVEAEAGKMRKWCAVRNKQPTRRRFVNWLNNIEKPLAGTGNGQPTQANEQRGGRTDTIRSYDYSGFRPRDQGGHAGSGDS